MVTMLTRARHKNVVQSLLESLVAQRKGIESRPIVFGCHSLGGIVVKRGLALYERNSHTSGNDVTRHEAIETDRLTYLARRTVNPNPKGVLDPGRVDLFSSYRRLVYYCGHLLLVSHSEPLLREF